MLVFAVLAGEAGVISLTASISDSRYAQRTQGLDFADRYVIAECWLYMHSTIVLAENVAFRIEKPFSIK